MSKPQAAIEALMVERKGQAPLEVMELRSHASSRRIFRCIGKDYSEIGVWHSCRAENRAFIAFARHFRGMGLPVPEVYQVSDDELAYLQQDLGDVTLYDLLSSARTSIDHFPPVVIPFYKRALEDLVHFQLWGVQDLDLSYCYPSSIYDQKAMERDARRFQDSFLTHVFDQWNDAIFSQEMSALCAFLASAPNEYFLYRDFQSRNIMVRGEELSYIDFQGGRKGALPYDLAALLYQSKAAIPDSVREALISHYLDALRTEATFSREQFLEHFDGFRLIRILQVLSVYGREGYGNGEQYFLESIPLAVKNLQMLLCDHRMPISMPYLTFLGDELAERIGDASN